MNDATKATEIKPAVKLSPFVEEALEPHPTWKVQSFNYYAAHFLIGTGLIYGDLDANVRALGQAMQKQYDIGVQHGATCPLEYAPISARMPHDHG